ncbi:FAD-binding oxidoreductase [Nocardia altamirensis]|uniref:FAD-binding oxidoreductase n=1 Tax=Nocardia altamirensis TaxID=472158 RepID=UPI00143563D1|nr:FAD-binding oxidoreductase [Nocardia altamirensis]
MEQRLRRPVSLASDPDYAKAKQLFNTRFDSAAPTAVVRVTSAADVATAVAFAAEHDVVLAARAGGHSYVGASAASGAMIIDLRGLTGLTYRDGMAVVAPGMTLQQVYRELDKHGQTIPAGMCPMVGVAGLTLGGGLGFEARRYGLTCDRLVAATMVLPDGTTTEVSPTYRPDLFWAVRGGGAHLGVVTSLTYHTCPATPKDVVELTFPGDQAAQVIAGWANWLRTAGRDQWADVSVDADGRGGLTCWLQLVSPARDGVRAAVELMTNTAKPLNVEYRSLSHLDAVTHLASGTPPRATFTCGSDVITELTADTIAAIVEAVTKHSRAGGTGWVQINALDGAIRDTGPTETAFPWRAHAALVEWGNYQPIPHERAAEWIAEAHSLVAPASAGAYINYLESGDPLERYYAHNYAQFAEIRRVVDPANRIHTVLTP